MEVNEADPLIGTLVADRYRVVRKLGEGGMGVVYQAVHEALRKPVAMKLLATGGRIDRESIARFEREAIAAANLRHPNVAEATDFGRLPDGALYLVMEYVEGTTLRRLIRAEGRLSPERTAKILDQVASALTTAHALDVVHRDLKPENIIITNAHGNADYVKVIDFGIARIRNATFGGGATGLTKAGTVFGTPEYMAPEQVMGQAVDAKADQYALGVMAFEMLTGKPPFAAPDIGQLMMMHVGAPIPSTRERAPTLSPAIDEVVSRMLAKMPDERFASVEEAMRTLSAAIAGTPPSQVVASAAGVPSSGGVSAAFPGSVTPGGLVVSATPAPTPSQPGGVNSGPTVNLGPSAPDTSPDATAATLQSFAFDASYAARASAAGTALLSTPSLDMGRGSLASLSSLQGPASVPGSNTVSGNETAQNTPAASGQNTLPFSGGAGGTMPHHLAPGATKKPPIAALAIGAASFLALVAIVVLLARSCGGSGSLPSAVTAALDDWKGGKSGSAAAVIKTALTDDPDLANNEVLARTLADNMDEEEAQRDLAELVRTTPLGKSPAMASALAQAAMRDKPKEARDAALDMLRDRQDLLGPEHGARVRLRDAEDCEELEDAAAEEQDLATSDTKRDLERIGRDDCKKMLHRPELCDKCRGSTSGPGGGKGRGKGKPKKEKHRK